MNLVVIPGFQQEPESSPLKEVSDALEPYFSDIEFIEWPQDKYGKSLFEEKVLNNIEEESVILGHSLGATIGLSLISRQEVLGMIAFDPIRKAIDDNKNELRIDKVSCKKPLLVFDSESEQIDIPEGNFERKKIETNHFFENSEKEIKEKSRNWVEENV